MAEAIGKRNAIFSIDETVHSSFKTACAVSGIGMSLVIERAMQNFSKRVANNLKNSKKKKS
jgi:glutamate/tyrosine decarboxylase-like PLP-dependent enzyme